MAAPLDVVIHGQALEDFGFQYENAFSGVGLMTFGFLWGCSDIWSPADNPALVTVWTDCTPPPGVYELCSE